MRPPRAPAVSRKSETLSMKPDRRLQFKVCFAAQTILIPLTQGKFAIIDACDAERVLGHRWHAVKIKRTFYAAIKGMNGAGKKAPLLMHRLILPPPPGLQVDHIDGNGLDNRRRNLRLATNTQNQQNCKAHRDNASGLKGVSWVKQQRKWAARLTMGGKEKRLGRFDTKEEAAAAYDRAALELFGEFARTNGLPLARVSMVQGELAL